jgi:hypothetical protein
MSILAAEPSFAESVLRVFAGGDVRRVAIVGSRDYPKMNLVRKHVGGLSRRYDGLVIVSGTEPGSRRNRRGQVLWGVDETALSEAARLGVDTLVFEPDWERYGKAAGPKRNQVIVDQSDDLVAYWDCESRGTAWTILMAAEAGTLRAVYNRDGDKMDLDMAVVLARLAVED